MLCYDVVSNIKIHDDRTEHIAFFHRTIFAIIGQSSDWLRLFGMILVELDVYDLLLWCFPS